jgi:Nif-specific regulatory protein
MFIAGPLKGTIIEITQDEIQIGRDPTNQVVVPDESLSRRQCFIRKEGERYQVVDLDSHNGTFLNQVPVKTAELFHGDLIQAGKSFFFFLQHEHVSESRLPPVQLNPGVLVTASTLRVNPEAALDAMTIDFGLLMKVIAAVKTIRSAQELQKKLLENLFEIVPATRGVIAYVNDQSLEPDQVTVLDKNCSELQPLQLSTNLARQVIRDKEAVFCKDVSVDDTLQKSDSIQSTGIKGLICVPLLILDRTIGFIYLDSRDPAVNFTEWHFQLVIAVSGIAAGPLDRARQLDWLGEENERLRAIIRDENSLIGESQKMREIYQLIAKVAPTDTTVLIRGQSGTGKELAAQAIHRNSPRAGGVLLAINCAVLSDALLESELFGHEKGAFTGAVSQKKGKLEIADGGTVFLDEVGEMSPTIQSKLLRVLQERTFERIGGTRPIKTDVRIIAATNKDLEAAIAKNEFRTDLYYRLNVISFEMPRLRDRAEDIPLLAHYFIAKYSRKCNRYVAGLSDKARQYLVSYSWPGNVRELENSIERAIVLGSTEVILPDDLPETLLEAVSSSAETSLQYHQLLIEAKRKIVLNALAQTGGSNKEAANLLGLHPNNLHRLIRNLGLKSQP